MPYKVELIFLVATKENDIPYISYSFLFTEHEYRRSIRFGGGSYWVETSSLRLCSKGFEFEEWIICTVR